MGKYIKLFRPSLDESSQCCAQIHANHYSCSYQHIKDMISVLKSAFLPLVIDDEEIQVQKYGGERKKGITFVEVFLPANTKMPIGWEAIKQIEYIL